MKNGLSKKFVLLWIGQFTSLLGTHMSGFALGLFVYEQTQSVMIYSLFPLFTILPEVVLAPIIGIYIDRWNRRKAMILGHAGAGVCTLIIMLFVLNNIVNVPLILFLIALSSLFNGFIFPAFIAATSQMVHSDQLPKTSGMNQFGFALVMIVSPAIAGSILFYKGLETVFLIDVITFMIAIIILFSIQISSVKKSMQEKGDANTLIKELATGFNYIKNNHFLLWTLILLAIINFNIGIIQVLITPLVLSMADSSVLGIVLSVAGLGMLIGSLFLMLFKKVNKNLNLILLFSLLQGSVFFMAVFQLSVLILGFAAFIFMFYSGIIAGMVMAIWQDTIPHELQGRIFSFQTFIVGGMILLGFLLSGPLSEQVFGPLMKKEGWMIERILDIIGPSQLPGIEALLLVLGIITIISVMGIYSILKFQGHFTKGLASEKI